MAGIFISYRREDSAGHAGRLYDQLSAHFGKDKTFIDVDTIQPGEDFVEAIESRVGACDALVALIGKNWLSCVDEEGNRRLDNPDDFIQIEVSAALKRNVRVIPVLLDGARMPRRQELPETLTPLLRRNALELSYSRFHQDAERLIEALEKVLTAADQTRNEAAAQQLSAGQAVRAAEEEEQRRRLALADLETRRVAQEKAEAERAAAEEQKRKPVAFERSEAERPAQKNEETRATPLFTPRSPSFRPPLAGWVGLALLVSAIGYFFLRPTDVSSRERRDPGKAQDSYKADNVRPATAREEASRQVAKSEPATPPITDARDKSADAPSPKVVRRPKQDYEEPTAPPSRGPATPQRIHVGGTVQAANLVSSIAPTYPPLAKQARIQGDVLFAAVIGKDGSVQKLELVSGHPLLVSAAQEAVKQWLYKPTLLNGEPVEVTTRIEVKFTLSQ